MVELLVVIAIIATLSVAMILNFRVSAKNKTARTQTASIIISDIRRAQSMALSGSRYQNNIVCGYGVHYVDSVTYLIYAKALPSGGGCASVPTRNYNSAGDFLIETRKIINPSMAIRSSFYDIFFEPPNPKTYINNDPSLTSVFSPATISIQLKGQSNCAQQSCTNISVYTSGELDFGP